MDILVVTSDRLFCFISDSVSTKALLTHVHVQISMFISLYQLMSYLFSGLTDDAQKYECSEAEAQTGLSGYIESPEWSQSRDGLVKCQWSIQAKDNNAIRLVIHTLHNDNNNSCVEVPINHI